MPSPHPRVSAVARRAMRWLGRGVVVLLAVALLPALLVGMLIAGGHVNLVGHAGFVVIASDDPLPSLGAAPVKRAEGLRRQGRQGGARPVHLVPADTAFQALCQAPVSDLAVARSLVQAFGEVRGAGVSRGSERQMTILGVPGWLAEHFPVRGGMTVLRGRGLLLLNPAQPLRGVDIYHELVHHEQFQLPEQAQRGMVDSLYLADVARPYPARRVRAAWGSVLVPLTWQMDSALVQEFRDSVRAATVAVPPGERGTSLRHLLLATSRVIEQPRFQPMQERLRRIAWLRRSESRPPHTFSWSDELRRLMAFETMAYDLAGGCAEVRGGSTAVLPEGGGGVEDEPTRGKLAGVR